MKGLFIICSILFSFSNYSPAAYVVFTNRINFKKDFDQSF